MSGSRRRRLSRGQFSRSVSFDGLRLVQLLKLGKRELAHFDESPCGGRLGVLLPLSDLTEAEQSSDTADDGDEAGALQDAVGFGIPAAGEDFPGVHIAPQGQETIGKDQEAFLSDGSAGKPGVGRAGCDARLGPRASWSYRARPRGGRQSVGHGLETLLDAVQAASDQLQLVRAAWAVGIRQALKPVGRVLDEAAHGGQPSGST